MEEFSTFPVTIRQIEFDKEGNPSELFIEETLDTDGKNSVLFPPKWKGLQKWKELKVSNFKKLMRPPGKKIEIEVDKNFILTRIVSGDTEYFINGDDDDYFFNTTTTSSTTPNAIKEISSSWENDPILNDFDQMPLLTPFSKKQKKINLSTSSFNSTRSVRTPISLAITIKKGSSEYKKDVFLNDIGSCAAIDFLSRLIEAYPVDSMIFQAMLSEFDNM